MRVRIGLVLPMLVLGVAAAGYVHALAKLRVDWRALELPVDLRPGVVRSTEFDVDFELEHMVLLEVERNLPFELLCCLLGESMDQADCGVDSAVDMEWTLRRGSQLVATGSSRDRVGGGFGTTITKGLGMFAASQDTTYTLEIVTAKDGSILAPTRPRVVVEVAHWYEKDYFFGAAIQRDLSLMLGALGVSWLSLWGLRTYARSRRAQRAGATAP